MSTGTASTSTGAPTTSASDTVTVTASGSTTDGGIEPIECDEGEIYVCRLDEPGHCGKSSSCESDYYRCVPGECTEECESQCRLGWDCVDGISSEVLVCVRDEYETCVFWDPECPEGSKCVPWADDGGSSWNAHKCTPLDPDPVEPGEVCTVEKSGTSGIDNCDATSMCWDVDGETLEGTCVVFCVGTDYYDATCPPGLDCKFTGDSVVNLCFPYCDPLSQDCPGDDLCIPDGESFSCVLDASGEAGFYGDPCEYANACKPGLYCLDSEYVEGCQAACCTPFCDTSKPLMCPGATQECIPWYEEGMAPPGYENVGICGIPL